MKSNLNSSIGFLIHDVARMMRWNFDRQAQGLGLTRAQWSVLAHLKRNNGAQQKVLAELMDVKPITLARHIDRLEQQGWVQRRDDPDDRRSKRLYLLPRAEPQLKLMQNLGQKVRKQALAGISEQEEHLLTELLTRIRDNLSTN